MKRLSFEFRLWLASVFIGWAMDLIVHEINTEIAKAFQTLATELITLERQP